MRNRLLAVIVALAGLGGVAAIPMSAQGRVVPPHKRCPAGENDTSYCTNFCPKGRLIDGQCHIGKGEGGGFIRPEGPPTVLREELWGAEKVTSRGPALKFDVKSGINGAPGLKKLVLLLPGGLTFKDGALASISGGRHTLTAKGRKLTVVLRSARKRLNFYLKNHTMVESQKLRRELSSHQIKTLTFKVSVTDKKGRVTRLAFVVSPKP